MLLRLVLVFYSLLLESVYSSTSRICTPAKPLRGLGHNLCFISSPMQEPLLHYLITIIGLGVGLITRIIEHSHLLLLTVVVTVLLILACLITSTSIDMSNVCWIVEYWETFAEPRNNGFANKNLLDSYIHWKQVLPAVVSLRQSRFGFNQCSTFADSWRTPDYIYGGLFAIRTKIEPEAQNCLFWVRTNSLWACCIATSGVRTMAGHWP